MTDSIGSEQGVPAVYDARGPIAPRPDRGLPLPKYQIGERVWFASTCPDTKRHPCPDCLGSQRWTVTTPAGATLEASCQRCGAYTHQDLPSLAYRVSAPVVRQLTIGSIRADTAAREWGERVEYMCEETGVGSGSVYPESKLFETEEAAQHAADMLAALENNELSVAPEAVQRARFANLTMTGALFEKARDAVWDSWRAYRFLREDLEGFVEEEPGETLQDMRDNLRHALEFERDYRDPHPLDNLIAAARQHIATSPVFRSRPTGFDGSPARLAQADAIASEDALIAALGAFADGPKGQGKPLDDATGAVGDRRDDP